MNGMKSDRLPEIAIGLAMLPSNPLPDSLKQVFACWVSSGFLH
jgi:hypothetical protein